MQKIGLFILSLFTIILVGNFTQAKDYEYTNLDIIANVKIDGTIDIKEKITANFFVKKHGIIRDIPLNYSVGGKDFHIEVSNINVYRNKFTTNESNGKQHIKIGDEKWTVIGKQNYPISYSTYGLIRNFSGMGYAELYWNLVGYEFDTNINKVRAELILPKIYTGFTKDNFLITTDGTAKTIDGFAGTVDWSRGDKIIITYDKGLSAYQGITLAIKFPNNYFEFDHDRQARLIGHVGISRHEGIGSKENMLHKITWIASITYVLFLLSLTFIKFDKNYIKKFLQTKGDLKGDFSKKYPIIIQYTPPKGLNSAEVGLLLHRGAKYIDILSLIYKWANEGFLSIEEDPGKSKYITLTKLKDIDKSFSEYEQTAFYTIFNNNTKKNFYNGTHINFKLAIEEIDEYGKEKGWLFSTKLSILKQKFCNAILLKILKILEFFIQIILFLLMGLLLMLINYSYGFVASQAGAFSFFIIILLPCFILYCLASNTIIDNLGIIYEKLSIKSCLKETEEGAKLISHILGYRKFLQTCDENKLRLFLEKDPLYFNKTLPYAVAFGLETELIEKTKIIMNEMNISPNRYNGELNGVTDTISTISSITSNYLSSSGSSYDSDSGGNSGSSYDSDSGWDSGSSFDSGGSSFDSGGGGGGGGGSSW